MELQSEISKIKIHWETYRIDNLFNSSLCWNYWKAFENTFIIDEWFLHSISNQVSQIIKKINISTKHYGRCEDCSNLDLCLEENANIVKKYIEKEITGKPKKVLDKIWKRDLKTWFTSFPNWYIKNLAEKKDFFE
jgi:hypothetical protein